MHHKHIYICTNIQTCVNNILLSISLSFASFVRTLAEIVVVLFLFLADRPFLPLGGLFSVFNVKCAKREREREPPQNDDSEKDRRCRRGRPSAQRVRSTSIPQLLGDAYVKCFVTAYANGKQHTSTHG